MCVVQELLLHWLGVKESVAPELPLARAELLGHFHASMQVGASPLSEARIYLDEHIKPWNLAKKLSFTRPIYMIEIRISWPHVPLSRMTEPDTTDCAAHSRLMCRCHCRTRWPASSAPAVSSPTTPCCMDACPACPRRYVCRSHRGEPTSVP